MARNSGVQVFRRRKSFATFGSAALPSPPDMAADIPSDQRTCSRSDSSFFILLVLRRSLRLQRQEHRTSSRAPSSLASRSSCVVGPPSLESRSLARSRKSSSTFGSFSESAYEWPCESRSTEFLTEDSRTGSSGCCRGACARSGSSNEVASERAWPEEERCAIAPVSQHSSRPCSSLISPTQDSPGAVTGAWTLPGACRLVQIKAMSQGAWSPIQPLSPSVRSAVFAHDCATISQLLRHFPIIFVGCSHLSVLYCKPESSLTDSTPKVMSAAN